MSKLLEIIDLSVEIDHKRILNHLSLEIFEGELVAILGPNGNGKTTLLMTIMGHPKYHITSGKILFKGQDITHLEIDKRAKLGLFFAMQHPIEVPGVNNMDFIKLALNTHREKPISFTEFYKKVNHAIERLKIPFDIVKRELNVGFSGGEKKRNEILQMILLEPQLSLIDEIDSGLDVDALTIIGNIINEENKAGRTFLLISHNAKFFEIIKPTRVVVIIKGEIVASGGQELFKQIDQEGFTTFGDVNQEEVNSLGLCGVKVAKK